MKFKFVALQLSFHFAAHNFAVHNLDSFLCLASQPHCKLLYDYLKLYSCTKTKQAKKKNSSRANVLGGINPEDISLKHFRGLGASFKAAVLIICRKEIFF